MKRIFALLLVLTLLCPAALADTVREQVNTPAHITDVFYSNTGKTTVQIDADITVPDVDKIPIYLVSPRLFNAEEMTRAADALFGEREWTGSTEYSTQSNTAYDGSVRTIYQAGFATAEEATECTFLCLFPL